MLERCCRVGGQIVRRASRWVAVRALDDDRCCRRVELDLAWCPEPTLTPPIAFCSCRRQQRSGRPSSFCPGVSPQSGHQPGRFVRPDSRTLSSHFASVPLHAPSTARSCAGRHNDTQTSGRPQISQSSGSPRIMVSPKDLDARGALRLGQRSPGSRAMSRTYTPGALPPTPDRQTKHSSPKPRGG